MTSQFETNLTPGDRLWSDWSALMTRVDPGKRLFAPAWYAAWASVTAGSGRWSPEIDHLTVRDREGTLLGVIPLGVQRLGPIQVRSSAGLWQPRRPFIDDASASAAVGRAAGRHLARRARAAIRLGPFRRSCEAFQALLASARASGAQVELDSRAHLAICEAPASWSQYRDGVLGAKFAKKLDYYERRAVRTGRMRIEQIANPDEARAAQLTRVLGSIEQRSWLAREGGNMRFATEAQQTLWTSLAAGVLAPLGAFDCWLMHIDDRPVSFCLTITIPPWRYVIANQYDEAVAEHRTGSILYRHMMEDGIDRGVRWFDFGDGHINYKSQWGASYVDDLDVAYVFPASVVGHLSHAAYRLFKRGAEHRGTAPRRAVGGDEPEPAAA